MPRSFLPLQVEAISAEAAVPIAEAQLAQAEETFAQWQAEQGLAPTVTTTPPGKGSSEE